MKKLDLKKIVPSGCELLSRSALKNILGGGSFNCLPVGSFCSVSEQCCEGLTCTNGICLQGELTCTITAKSTPGCGNGATITFPSGTTTAQAQAWCNSQPCCGSISC